MLVARAGAAINVSLGVGDLDPAEPCWPFCYSIRDEEKAERNRYEEWKQEQLKVSSPSGFLAFSFPCKY